MQTTTSKTFQKPRGKKKNNNYRRKNSSTKIASQTNHEATVGGNQSKRKYKYLCMVFQEDHMTKDCPHLNDVHNYVKKGQPSSQLAVLTNRFLAPQQMVARASSPPSRGP